MGVYTHTQLLYDHHTYTYISSIYLGIRRRLRHELENLCSLLFSWISGLPINLAMSLKASTLIPLNESILALFLKLVQEKVS